MTSPVSDAKEELASTAGPRNMPWQALSALASEYGNAVREKFTQDPRISASGCVEQSRRVHASVLDQSGESPASSQPQDADRDLKFAEAVQADIQRVDRKIIAADASKQVILRFNFMSGAEARIAMLCIAASILAGAGVLIIEFTKKVRTGNTLGSMFQSTAYVWNTAVSSTCLLLLTISLSVFVWRITQAIRLHKKWKHRQRRNVTLILVEAAVQWINLIFYLVPNTFIASNICYVESATVYWFGFVRWTCWNTIFMLFLIHAHSTRVWKQREADNSRLSVAAIEHGFQSPEGHSKLVMDGPWILLWPCFLMWPFFEAVIAYAWIHNALEGDKEFAFCEEYLEEIRSYQAQGCGVDRGTAIAVDITIALAAIYFAATYVLLILRLRSYRLQAYTSVQVGIVYNTLQLWLRMVVMSFFILCLVMLWLVNPSWCASTMFSWMGLMPMQIVMSVVAIVLCYVASPKTPKEHTAATRVWLQEFAWTEADKPIKLAARWAMVPGDDKLARQPIFCFETMLNLLYWSCFVYGHKKDQVTPGNSPSKGTPDPQQPLDLHTELGRAAPEQQQQQQYKVQPEFGKPSCEQWQQLNPLSKLSLVEQQQQQQPALGKQLEGNSFTGSTTLNLETALSLYGLTESQSFWEVQQDTRCLMGWGGNTVVVSFRGTASMKNALADLQAWRIAHPPIRGQTWLGTRPLVHVGFLKSWLAGGLKTKVVNQVLEAVHQCKQQSGRDQPVTVFVTGHSLGGALATLAAFDMRQHLMNNGQGDARVVCYTFAAPRTGNHAFAREYNALVPDTFSIINDQDVVTREGKMLFMYKRPGQRVIVNAAGHMMVRPTHIEASAQKSVGGQSVRHHMLTNYFHAILTVVLHQFNGLGFADGMEGVVRLAEASPYIRDLLERQMGMGLAEMRTFCQADPPPRPQQGLPGAHLPPKGFWIVKRPTAPSTMAPPSLLSRLRQKVANKPLLATPALQKTSAV